MRATSLPTYLVLAALAACPAPVTATDTEKQTTYYWICMAGSVSVGIKNAKLEDGATFALAKKLNVSAGRAADLFNLVASERGLGSKTLGDVLRTCWTQFDPNNSADRGLLIDHYLGTGEQPKASAPPPPQPYQRPPPQPDWLALRPGLVCRTGDNGGDDTDRLSVYRTVEQLDRVFDPDHAEPKGKARRPGTLVRVLSVENRRAIWEQEWGKGNGFGLFECERAVHIQAVGGNWSGYVLSHYLVPVVPVGTVLYVSTGAAESMDLCEGKNPETRGTCFALKDRTKLVTLEKTSPQPPELGALWVRAKVLSGAESGREGWYLAMVDGVDVGNGQETDLIIKPDGMDRDCRVPGDP